MGRPPCRRRDPVGAIAPVSGTDPESVIDLESVIDPESVTVLASEIGRVKNRGLATVLASVIGAGLAARTGELVLPDDSRGRLLDRMLHLDRLGPEEMAARAQEERGSDRQRLVRADLGGAELLEERVDDDGRRSRVLEALHGVDVALHVPDFGLLSQPLREGIEPLEVIR